ncbi:MAG: hypothetical protein OJJ54_06710 [Pseudonocardia sp.]|nr:hypothetical protein [Pseudonocardia sp.]
MRARSSPSGAGSWAGPAVRAAVLASVGTLFAALGHLAGGGTLSQLGLLVVLGPLLAFATVGFAEWTRGPVGLLLVLAGGQFALHELLEVLGHTHVAAAQSPSGASMLTGHAVATLLTAALLRDVDVLLGLVVAGIRRALPRRLTPRAVDVAPVTLPVPAAGVIGHTARATVSALLRRGPPVRVRPRIPHPHPA